MSSTPNPNANPNLPPDANANRIPLPELSPADHDFARLWAESTARVLEQLHGSPFTATPLSPASADAPAADALCSHFKAAGYPSGELAFHLTRADGVRLAQLLMSEPLDASVAVNETHADGLREIFRQFAGLASAACKSAYGREVQFSLDSQAAAPAPEWEPAGRAIWIFAAPKVDPIQWTLALSPDLHASLLAPPPAEGQASTQIAAPQPSFAPQANDSAPTNLDLLLDVELEASLRFGQREMLLRDILELHPGSVIELDRRVQEPAELIVSGRVIAHGEVVIVDGNYGLRITDIAQANQRLASVET